MPFQSFFQSFIPQFFGKKYFFIAPWIIDLLIVRSWVQQCAWSKLATLVNRCSPSDKATCKKSIRTIRSPSQLYKSHINPIRPSVSSDTHPSLFICAKVKNQPLFFPLYFLRYRIILDHTPPGYYSNATYKLDTIHSILPTWVLFCLRLFNIARIPSAIVIWE